MTAPRLLFVVNNPAFFLSHRLPIALAAQRAGFDVHVATMDGDSVPRIQAHGFTHHVIPMTRSGQNPLQEIRTVWALYRLFRQLQPDVVHLVTIKPVLYGGIAARLARVPGVVSAISGLGFVFVAQGIKAAFVRQVVTQLYRIALGHRNSRVVFQNSSDRDVLRGLKAVRDEQVVMIRGSGVNLADYVALPEPELPIVVLMVARLLRDKGIIEFVDAARLLRQAGVNVRMRVAGSIDVGNPASVSQADVDVWHKSGLIEALGERSDIAALNAASHIAVLPSYREGLPRSLIEAAACGRAVVTTDVPGCRDAIEPNVTGLLVPSHDGRALADAIALLASDADLRQRMGAAGRELAEREFDVDDVSRKHVVMYQSLQSTAKSE